MTKLIPQSSAFLATSRRFRPQRFSDVIGQQACVKTLQNALKKDHLASAYLITGPRGTGKTTLARLFAKAMNCPNLIEGEPCNTCASCTEITLGNSLDVVEIDGASHRGIDDIRAITESVGYSPSSGRYKIYIIDEVHMLTKEAFNALLKTLEEPPKTAKFFFATTEPHKIPQTIISRCQRFNLQRITKDQIAKKLSSIAQEMSIFVQPQAILRLAEYAEGGLRDAESLFDQLVAFSDGEISESVVEEVLGLVPYDIFYALDTAYIQRDFKKAVDLASTLYRSGKDITYFLDDLANHYRYLLYLLIGSKELLHHLPTEYQTHLQETVKHFNNENCLAILDLILQAHTTLKGPTLASFAIEALLLEIIQVQFRISHASITHALFQLQAELQGEQGVITQPPQELIKKTPQPINTPQELPKKPTPTPSINSATVSQQETPKKPEPQPIPKITTASTLPPPKLPEEQARIREENLVQFSAIELEGQLIKPKGN